METEQELIEKMITFLRYLISPEFGRRDINLITGEDFASSNRMIKNNGWEIFKVIR